MDVCQENLYKKATDTRCTLQGPSVPNKRKDLIVGVRILKNLINRGSKDSLDRKSLGIKVSARGGVKLENPYLKIR